MRVKWSPGGGCEAGVSGSRCLPLSGYCRKAGRRMNRGEEWRPVSGNCRGWTVEVEPGGTHRLVIPMVR